MGDPGQPIRLRSSARTNTGKLRDNNEDNVHLWSRDHLVLAIVADGMGGAAAGEEASRIAVETIQEGLADPVTTETDPQMFLDEDSLTDRMRHAIRTANLTIVQRAERFSEFKGMGTTVTMVMVRNTYAVIGHVGDSRAYLVDGRDGHIIQVTADHSFVQALVSAGHISEEEAEDHPMKNVLYRALGQARDVEIDIYYERLQIGDRLVLCSDGLTLHVKPEEIAQITLAADNPEEASQKLIELANTRGGRDNISVIVIKVEEDDAPIPTQLDYQLLDDPTIIFGKNTPRPFSSSESLNSPAPQERDGKMSLRENTDTATKAPIQNFSQPRPISYLQTPTNYIERKGGLLERLYEGQDRFLPE